MNLKLQFMHLPQGYINVLEGHKPPQERLYDYVYQYKDHLEDGALKNSPVDCFSERARWRAGGLSFAYDRDRQEIRTLTEHNYYPFGLEHSYLQTRRRPELVDSPTLDGIIAEPVGLESRTSQMVQVDDVRYQYRYNGKEFQDELGLNFYDYGARNYDPAIGRWMNIDPLAEMYPDISPYVYVANTPTMFVDYDGKHFGIEIDHESKKITITGHFYASKEDMKLLNEIAAFLNEQTGNVLKVGEGEDAIAYNIGFKITTEESSDPKESAKKANLEDKEGGNNNSFRQDSIDSMYSGSERGAASAFKAAIKDGEGLFAGVHEALHLLGSGLIKTE